uniref:Uncharacterized protein n=1 Tax=Rhizophora mucronata TaxID=61149 RepID=A0A2P2Q7K2_RHIMU
MHCTHLCFPSLVLCTLLVYNIGNAHIPSQCCTIVALVLQGLLSLLLC